MQGKIHRIRSLTPLQAAGNALAMHVQMSKFPMFQTTAALIILDLNFGDSILFRDSCFGFRI
ncbi:MAG: hypothetical protein ACOYU4_10465 [Thermodesulfobacteriota bacterium]